MVSDKVEGIKVSRIRFSPLTLDQARSLTAKLGGQVSSWGKHLGAKEVGRDLDTALRAAKIIANPSLIVVSSVNGLMTNELLPPSLTLIHAERLVRILEEVSQ
ncbi:hypothetical protein SNA_36075 [Streptomyces natalensis ATCC 27448]|uniref:Uncharacterized protein n=1 Tax=Streptomyces natalensis ATCC 27448 TaxID=1240678 RepID=A0A0D7CGD7_9ACTN|nr:hypothetical protein SNA_36075 [Streptomyces natalensis ATCC 27448]